VEAGLPADRWWRHVPSAWLFDAGMLMALAVVLAGLVRFRLRLGKRAC
jgi:ABC transport system ATP-binding/permease protein